MCAIVKEPTRVDTGFRKGGCPRNCLIPKRRAFALTPKTPPPPGSAPATTNYITASSLLYVIYILSIICIPYLPFMTIISWLTWAFLYEFNPLKYMPAVPHNDQADRMTVRDRRKSNKYPN